MKVIIIVAAIAVVGLMGAVFFEQKNDKINYSKPQKNYIVRVVDGCEYITFLYGNGTYVHKGNCTNSIHIYK